MSSSPTKPKTCTHDGCPKSFDHDPALEVTCPTCDAEPGDLCRRPSGHAVWNADWPGLPKGIHPDRDREALRQGAYGSCPLNQCPESVEDLAGDFPRSSAQTNTETNASDSVDNSAGDCRQSTLETF